MDTTIKQDRVKVTKRVLTEKDYEEFLDEVALDEMERAEIDREILEREVVRGFITRKEAMEKLKLLFPITMVFDPNKNYKEGRVRAEKNDKDRRLDELVAKIEKLEKEQAEIMVNKTKAWKEKFSNISPTEIEVDSGVFKFNLRFEKNSLTVTLGSGQYVITENLLRNTNINVSNILYNNLEKIEKQIILVLQDKIEDLSKQRRDK